MIKIKSSKTLLFFILQISSIAYCANYEPPIINPDIQEKFFKAITTKDFQTAKELIENNLINVNGKLTEYSGKTPLILALCFPEEPDTFFSPDFNLRDIILLLLEKGADVNILDNNYNGALNYALKNYDKHLVRIILAHGAHVTPRSGYIANLLIPDFIPPITDWIDGPDTMDKIRLINNWMQYEDEYAEDKSNKSEKLTKMLKPKLEITLLPVDMFNIICSFLDFTNWVAKLYPNAFKRDKESEKGSLSNCCVII